MNSAHILCKEIYSKTILQLYKFCFWTNLWNLHASGGRFPWQRLTDIWGPALLGTVNFVIVLYSLRQDGFPLFQQAHIALVMYRDLKHPSL